TETLPRRVEACFGEELQKLQGSAGEHWSSLVSPCPDDGRRSPAIGGYKRPRCERRIRGSRGRRWLPIAAWNWPLPRGIDKEARRSLAQRGPHPRSRGVSSFEDLSTPRVRVR